MNQPFSESHPFLVDQLCFSVYGAHRLFNRVYTVALSPFDLTYTQYLVLLSLWEGDAKTLTEIAHQLSLKSNTLTPVLKRLETTGWLIKQNEATDKRSSRIYLTEKGKQQKEAVFQSIESYLPIETQEDFAMYQEALHIVQALNQKLGNLEGA